MRKQMLEILEKTYNNPILRENTCPLFMTSPGVGKSSIIKEFAKNKKVKLAKITLSQRMPNEVISMLMPNTKTGKLEVFDSLEITSLNSGDILFFDEIFNGTLKATLDAVLNFTEDRVTPSGKKIEGVMIVAASNPQGLINITPQIKERFIRYDLQFDELEFQSYLKYKYGMPENISKHLCTLIKKEKFEHNEWNYKTPRSIEKAINQIAVGMESPYDAELLPFLKQTIKSPMGISLLNIKKDEEVEYLELLKLIVQNNNK